MDRAVFIGTMVSLASAAFGVIAALAWNAFVTEALRQLLGEQAGLVGLFIYAVIVTVVAVLVIMWLGRLAANAAAEKKVL